MRECARRLAGPYRRIDPAIGEKTLRDIGHLRREAAIGRQDHIAGVGPGDAAGGGERQRRVAIPMRELLLFEPACLELIIAMRQFRIGRANRTHQRIDHLALDAIGQMPRIRDVLKTAPAIGNLLVLGQRVGDERKRALVGLESFCQRLPGRLALCGAAILQQIKGRLDRKLLAPDLEAQAGDGLIEQPVKGGVAALGFLVEQLLDPILQLIRLVLSQILDPRTVMRQFRRRHRALNCRIFNAVELKREKQQMHRRIGQPLGNVAVEFGNRRIDAVAGMNQAGIGRQTPGEIVDRLVAPDRFGEPFAATLAGGFFRELALVVRLKRDAIGVHLLQIAGRFRRVDSGIEIGQVPFRQLCRFGFGRGLSDVRFALGGGFGESRFGARGHLVRACGCVSAEAAAGPERSRDANA
jgi:hypothetical protein